MFNYLLRINLIIILFISCTNLYSMTAEELIEYTKKYKNITLEYDVHPFLVFGIAWQETKFNPLTININKISTKLTKRSYYEFINIFSYLFNNQTTPIKAYRINCIFYKDNKILARKAYIFKKDNYEKLSNILNADFIDLSDKGFNKVYISSNYPIPFTFDTKTNAVLYTTRLTEIIDNIDIGLTQINNKYWLKPNNIPVAKVFEPEFALMYSSKILAELRDETNKNLYKMIKYYHSRTNGIGDKYANATIKHINHFTNMFNTYVENMNNSKVQVAKNDINNKTQIKSYKQTNKKPMSITEVLAENNIIILN